MLDSTLAIIHHFFAFSLLGCLVGEWILLMEAPSRSIVQRLSKLDLAYGSAAVGSLTIGISRVVWGIKPSSFYTNNPVFWAKMLVWGVVAGVSVLPTIRFIKWQRSPTLPSAADFSAMKRLLAVELVF